MTSSSLILVVDDTPANLEVACDTLNDAGYEVATAIDGDRALKRVQVHPPDLILLDVQMPELSGFEVCRQLKVNPNTAHIPVIFMTALSDTDSKVEGLDLGAVDYITKPFQERELLARVKTHLQIAQLTKTLEQTVAERTITLEQLQRTQLQMVQSEKMSALGQTVAGIAHEINNPVNFIHGNLIHVQNYVRDLSAFVRLYQQYYPQPVPEIQAQEEAIDLKFLQEDLAKILSSMKIGTDRIRQIVLSLRNFSRMDEAEFKAVDIHEGINSTLMILQHRLKARPPIEIIRNYTNLPRVECYPGQLNQVVMNLLANALDALEEVNAKRTLQEIQEHPSQITIRTSIIADQWVEIAIADNGPGIPEDLKARIFDPFFTTKSVGKGTGMGLSISYQIIVEKHGGKLECFSAPNQGTEFVIQIPIRQSAFEAS